MNRKDIDRLFTEKVSALLAQGYTINPATMTGSQGEIAKVDLVKGNELLRVLLDRESVFTTKRMETLVLRVGRCHNPGALVRTYKAIGCDVWNSELEVIEEQRFACIADDFFTTEEEGDAIAKKRVKRFVNNDNSREGKRDLTGNDKAKAIVLKYLRMQPRMRSCKASDIERIERINRSGKLAYVVTARGKVFRTH